MLNQRIRQDGEEETRRRRHVAPRGIAGAPPMGVAILGTFILAAIGFYAVAKKSGR